MRYDTPIYFQEVSPGIYDENTGDYKEDTVSENVKYASVMDTQAEMLKLLFGTIDQKSLTAHINGHYNRDFDRIRVGNRTYTVSLERKLRSKHTFVLKEVQ